MSAGVLSLRRPGALPRWGLPWLVWRQHRLALLAAVAALAVAALVLVLTWSGIRASYTDLGVGSCRDLSQARCRVVAGQFVGRYGWMGQVTDYLALLPMLVGGLVGAPLVAREYETGTFRFAFTQGCGRTRWVVAKLGMLAAAVTVPALAFSALFATWYTPFEPLLGRMSVGGVFDVDGVVFAAHTLFAFVLGAFLGALLRRTVAALGATIAGWLAVVLTTMLFLRRHYPGPVVHRVAPYTMSGHSTGWPLARWWAGPHGEKIGDYQLQRQLGPAGDPAAWAARHGYTAWESYQPPGRFWTFQGLEAGGLFLLAVILAAGTVLLVRRRAMGR
jgi:hypothetical protein